MRQGGEPRLMRIVHALILVVLASQLGSTAGARAQSARRGMYYNRMTTARGHASAALERGGGVGTLEPTSARSAPNLDLLSPYSPRASTAYSSEPPVARPAPRPLPRPVSRNYYPTARSGQTRHCTPSRARAFGR